MQLEGNTSKPMSTLKHLGLNKMIGYKLCIKFCSNWLMLAVPTCFWCVTAWSQHEVICLV